MNASGMALKVASKLPKTSRHLGKSWQEIGGANLIAPYWNLESLNVLKKPETWVLFAFISPVLAFYLSNPSRERLFIVLMGYFALAWAVCFYVFVAKRRTSIWIGLATAVFTRLIGRWFGHLLRITILAPFYHINESSTDILRVIGVFGSYGFNEELLKDLPVLLLTFVLKRIKTPVDGMFYGAMSGLSFAAWEGYNYLDDPTKGDALMVAFLRITIGMFMHAAYPAIAGYFIALAVSKRRPSVLCALGIGIATTLHTLYDIFTATHGPLVVIVVFLVFIAYADRSQRIASEVGKKEEEIPTNAQPEIVEVPEVASGA